ncbi:hypothetical protein CMI47_18760 [Candidatus Pacearchaeota archaeon]|nr:hypothetical protein [Candidatus Pacearchaeota archaeon]|tara:strand:+ start:4637 stop:5131 length:495 start_codon:yes stop_codon:yes gene_type:complete
MSDFLKISGEIDALTNIRLSLDENAKKIEKNLEIDKIIIERSEGPCAHISRFIKGLEGELNSLESVEKKYAITVAALSQISKFSSEYALNERMGAAKKEGMLEGFRIYMQTIDEHISEKKRDIEALQRIESRIHAGDDLKNRKTGERPERIRDIRMLSENKEGE